MGLLVGLESVSHGERARLRKLPTDSKKLEDGIRTIRRAGIQFHPSFVFGFDSDTRGVFRDTLQFLERNRIGTADFFSLTPYPGTEVYRRLESEGRLLTRDWDRYDAIAATYQPLQMSPQDLQTGLAWTKRQFLRIASIGGRFPHNLTNAAAFLAVNLGYRKNFRRHVRGGKYGPDVSLRSLSRAGGPPGDAL
jgi:radical SAM superfamily enzyme YgiQ (UPF0313 family)